MPAKRSVLTRRNSKTITGQFNSVREDGVHRVFKSHAEFLHLSILDVDPEVSSFITQIEAFRFASEETFTADAFVTFKGGRRPVFRMVTWLSRIREDPDLHGRRARIEEACDQRSADFEVVTERFWADPIAIEIARSLRHAARRAKRVEMDIITSALEDGALSLAELSRKTGLSHRARSAALSLCAKGRAAIRRDRPIDQTTLFWLT